MTTKGNLSYKKCITHKGWDHQVRVLRYYPLPLSLFPVLVISRFLHLSAITRLERMTVAVEIYRKLQGYALTSRCCYFWEKLDISAMFKHRGMAAHKPSSYSSTRSTRIGIEGTRDVRSTVGYLIPPRFQTTSLSDGENLNDFTNNDRMTSGRKLDNQDQKWYNLIHVLISNWENLKPLW